MDYDIGIVRRRRIISPDECFFAAPAPAAASYTAQGVSFDGATAYMHRGAGLTGAVNGKLGIVSFWFNLQGGDGNFLILFEDVGQGLAGFKLSRSNTNVWAIQGVGAGAVNELVLVSNSTYLSGGGWHHFLAAWDLGASVGQLYVDNAPDLAGGSTLLNANIAYSSTGDEFFAARSDPSLFYNGYLADFYLNQAETLDISNSANRAKFISGGHPVDLGSDGHLPTGNPPIVYFSGAGAIVAPGGSVTSWATNKGTGGGFTIGAGSLTASATNP